MTINRDSMRRTARTAVQVTVALAVAVPLLVEAGVLDVERWPWLGTIVAIAAVITRLMATPQADTILAPVGLDRGQPDGRHEAGADAATSDGAEGP